jgi:hypothetical protein
MCFIILSSMIRQLCYTSSLWHIYPFEISIRNTEYKSFSPYSIFQGLHVITPPAKHGRILMQSLNGAGMLLWNTRREDRGVEICDSFS